MLIFFLIHYVVYSSYSTFITVRGVYKNVVMNIEQNTKHTCEYGDKCKLM